MKFMKVAIYPGSFDPITLGHMDIIDRACSLFDKIIIAIAKSETKDPLFSLEDRLKLAKTIYKDNSQVEVIGCLLYTSPSPRDSLSSRMPSSA